MSIKHQNKPHQREHSGTADQKHDTFFFPQKLAVNHPSIFFFILYAVLIRPNRLKTYRSQLNSTERLHFNRQAARLTTTLVWLPFLTIFTVIWQTSLLQIGGETAVLALIVAVIACFISFDYHLSISQQSINNMLLASIVGGFGITAVLTAALNNADANGSAAIMLVLLSFIFTLMGLCIAMVFKLRNLEKLCGIIAVFSGGCIAITMLHAMTTIWLPILIILCAVLLVGITEERHQLNGNQQSIFHR